MSGIPQAKHDNDINDNGILFIIGSANGMVILNIAGVNE